MNLLLENSREKIGYNNVQTFLLILSLCLKVKTYISICIAKVLCSVQFTVQVFLGLTFHKNLEFLRKMVADLLSKKPLGAP